MQIFKQLKNKVMRTAEIIESVFTKNEVDVLKATIRFGFWGDGSHVMGNGETKEGNGYFTEDAKMGVSDLTPKQIAGVYSSIAKKIKGHKFGFMNHVSDYWETGKTSEGMIFLSDDVILELEEWAKK